MKKPAYLQQYQKVVRSPYGAHALSTPQLSMKAFQPRCRLVSAISGSETRQPLPQRLGAPSTPRAHSSETLSTLPALALATDCPHPAAPSLRLSGAVSGATLELGSVVNVQIAYDPPP